MVKLREATHTCALSDHPPALDASVPPGAAGPSLPASPGTDNLPESPRPENGPSRPSVIQARGRPIGWFLVLGVVLPPGEFQNIAPSPRLIYF